MFVVVVFFLFFFFLGGGGCLFFVRGFLLLFVFVLVFGFWGFFGGGGRGRSANFFPQKSENGAEGFFNQNIYINNAKHFVIL